MQRCVCSSSRAVHLTAVARTRVAGECLAKALTGRDHDVAAPLANGVPSLPSSHPSTTADRRPYESRRLLRGLLRECTFLPDSHARKWTKEYVLNRYRRYQWKAWEHRKDEEYGRRLDRKLKDAKAGLGLLKRANDGERKPLLKILLMAYGRIGKRRHELMLPLLPAAMQAELRRAENEAESDPPNEVQAPGPSNRDAPGIFVGHPVSADDLTPQMRALLQSQLHSPPPHLTRTQLRRINPQIDELNSWHRPMPRKRVNNQLRKWYADLLSKVHPPLSMPEWLRLKRLALGEETEAFIPRRKFLADPRSGPLEMVMQFGKPNAKQAFGNRDAHQLTRRYMQRLWAQVFAQCPVMAWDTERAQWLVTWGEQTLHGHVRHAANRTTIANTTASTAEVAPLMGRHEQG
jgi:hypothetical protein